MIPFREQNNGLIVLTGDKERLPIVQAWKKASSIYWIKLPFYVQTLRMKIGNITKTEYVYSVQAFFHPEQGLWRVYVPGSYFTDRCETLYKIEATDENGSRTVFGEGIMRVSSGSIYDHDDDDPLTEECYAKFTDGKWRKVVVGEDEVGALTFDVYREGTAESMFVNVPANPYAYNKQTGLFYAVSGFIDEAGEPYLELAQQASAGTETFAKSEATGFYYRVESFADETGNQSLNVGDIKQ